MKLFAKLNLMVLCAVAFASCGTDDPDKDHLVDTFDGYFGYAVDATSASTSEGYILPVGKIEVDFVDDDKKATVTITNLSYGSGTAPTTVNQVMTDLPFTANADGVRTVVAENVKGSGVNVDRIVLVYYPDHNFDEAGELYHGLAARLKIGDSDITLLPSNPVGVGTTETTCMQAIHLGSTSIEAGSKYVATKTLYEVAMNPEKRTASVSVVNAAFAQGMPTLDAMLFAQSAADPTKAIDMQLRLVPGGYSLEAPVIVPSIDGVPYPRYIVTSFSAEAQTDANKMDLQFTCMGVFEVNAVLSGCYTRQLHPVQKK